MTISIIVAVSENRVIGVDNDMPWHLPADLKYFKATTLGKPILMGRKTYDSIGRALPGRRNMVITRDPDWRAEGVEAFPSIDAARAAIADDEDVMVIGGAQIYAQALPFADRLYITEIGVTVDGGHAFFPDVELGEWREDSRESHPAEGGNPSYAFVVYSRR